MSKEKTSFVYVTYIRSTPEKVFEAITKPEIARRYWGHENVSDWKPGRPGSTCAPTSSARSSWSARWSKSRRRRAWSSRGRTPRRPPIRPATAA
jgi:hypothetical protein